MMQSMGLSKSLKESMTETYIEQAMEKVRTAEKKKGPGKIPTYEQQAEYFEEVSSEIRNRNVLNFADSILTDYKTQEELIAKLNADLKEVKSKIVSSFWGDHPPHYTQGEPTHELQDYFTAEDATGLVNTILRLESELEIAKEDYLSFQQLTKDALDTWEKEYKSKVAEIEALKQSLVTAQDSQRQANSLFYSECNISKYLRDEIVQLRRDISSDRDNSNHWHRIASDQMVEINRLTNDRLLQTPQPDRR